MTASSLSSLSAIEIRDRVASGEVSAIEVTQHFLDRIAHADRKTNAFLYVDSEGALAQAATVDRARQRGETLGPLAGVPVALKDNLSTRGVPTTCASKILAGYVPPYDADAVQRLRRAGAIAVGKTNMDEFAMGSSNENSAFGAVKNPWDLSRAPGGSSGGSAAATAASMATFALGSDTGGSVRQPGAFCGVTAMKPTYGRVSRYGLIAFASSLDQIGTFARSARESARILSVIAGHDARDATSVTNAVDDYEGECGKDLRGLRVGVVTDALRTRRANRSPTVALRPRCCATALMNPSDSSASRLPLSVGVSSAALTAASTFSWSPPIFAITCWNPSSWRSPYARWAGCSD